jgi:hypothetical protein
MRIAMHDSPKTSYIIVTWSIQSKRFQKKFEMQCITKILQYLQPQKIGLENLISQRKNFNY